MSDRDPLASLRFDNRFVREMPADPSTANHPRQVAGAAYSLVSAAAVAKPQLVAHAHEVATGVGLDADAVVAREFAEVFAGNRLATGMATYATCYGGHQFGHWAGQLGDGRAIGLGEVLGPDDRRWELQLKGAGPTPYSRRADGRAVLRSSVREFLCSEAMHHLGVPTTRALSLVTTGDSVVRDMFYDGNEEREPGAIVCRVAPSFTRFGHFELPASRGDVDLLRRWVEHTVRGHFPELVTGGGSVDRSVIIAWLAEVARRTAIMIVGWMRVGFVHGVMNTDNMSILGLTIDYGPYGWLDDFNPGWTPNTTDANGRRYRFDAQPWVAHWNVARFAESLLPLVDDVKALSESLDVYATTFDVEFRRMQRAKVGLLMGGNDSAESDGVDDASRDLHQLLAVVETDMTIFYRRLADVPSRPDASDDALLSPLAKAWYATPIPIEHRSAVLSWLRDYTARLRELGVRDEDRRPRMNAVNPKYVLRNYMAQVAIDAAAEGDSSIVDELLELLRRPYDESPESERWFARRPEWARHRAGCSMLSCSS